MFDWVLKTPVPRINPQLSLSSLNHSFTCLGKYSLTSFILKYQSFIKTIGHLNLWSHETFADHFTFSKATSNLDFYLLVFSMFSTNCLWVWRLKDWKKFSRVTSNPEIMNFQNLHNRENHYLCWVSYLYLPDINIASETCRIMPVFFKRAVPNLIMNHTHYEKHYHTNRNTAINH